MIFTPPVQEAMYQGWQAVIAGSKNAKTDHGRGGSGLEEGW